MELATGDWDWDVLLDGEMGAVTEVLRAHAPPDIVKLELATWRERVKQDRVATCEKAAEVAARAAVNVIAAAVETDAETRLKLFLHICSRVKAEQ